MTNKATDDEIIIKEVANADILHDLRDHFLGKHSGYLGLTTDYSLGRKKNDTLAASSGSTTPIVLVFRIQYLFLRPLCS